MPDTVELPNTVPVMPLTGVLLFPNALLPLHIFEPRFREMLAHALDDDRMLCVALVRPERPQWRTSADFFPISTVGLIRACIGRSDGTSDLILQGIRRVKFSAFEQEAPFPIARIKPLKTRTKLTVATDALAAKVLEFYAQLKESGRGLPEKIDRYLSEMTDSEMLADLIAATFITEPARRQQLLEELDLNQRLRLLIQFLREENGHSA
ncbi:MAG: LON peptidase substrate-binding domain-containing protein [Chthoniobacterales bacterium]|nr:LON peptidase substrate-binding domain-containing protein [Chthoniobacterales bacterium]